MPEPVAADRGDFLHKTKKIFDKHAVLIISVLAASVTMLWVAPDAEYLRYPDFKTLACLFSVLAVVNALRNIDFFGVLAKKLVSRFSDARSCCLALCAITFFSSMFIVNDMALLTFLPLGALILLSAGRKSDLAFLFIMQNFSANLGGMLTPFGNPQNLYLYAKYGIGPAQFIAVMLPPFIVSGVMIALCCLLVDKTPLEMRGGADKVSDPRRMTVYLVLLAVAIAMVFRGVPYLIGTPIIAATLFALDRRVFRQLDYSLLATFLAFFVFAGNMARIPAVRQFLSAMLEKSALTVSVLTSQVISNVPAAILMSQFTDNWHELLLGVNIGGSGTLVASLASLITLREYQRQSGGSSGFFGKFALFNVPFLLILTGVGFIEVFILNG
jgi:Na+/H+ antiporter NhaD and related arsenite permeases